METKPNGKYYWYGTTLEKVGDWKNQDGFVYAICDDGDGNLSVYNPSGLARWEDTYQFGEQKKIKDETQRLKDEKVEVMKKIRAKAHASLVSRLKMNSVFGNHKTELSIIGLQVAEELEKILEKEVG